MSGEGDYHESVGNYSDLKPHLNASQPVHTVKANVGDSHSIAAGFAERATGNPDDYEQGKEAIDSEKREERKEKKERKEREERDYREERDEREDRDEREERDKRSSESANGENLEKKPSSFENQEDVPTPEQSEEAERAIMLADYEARKDEEREGPPVNIYTGKVALATVGVIVAGIAALFFKTKRNKN